MKTNANKIDFLCIGILVGLAICKALPRIKRQTAYLLPDGIELILDNPMRTSFTCEKSGYYADTDNGCQLFHVCHAYTRGEGKIEMSQHTFACANQTGNTYQDTATRVLNLIFFLVFNQLTQTCHHPSDAIECGSSNKFHRLNENLGVTNTPFLNDQDLEESLQYLNYGLRTPKKSKKSV